MTEAKHQATTTVGHFQIQARWDNRDGTKTSDRATGPTEVVVTLLDTAPSEVASRGITSGVLRQVERAVLSMTEMRGGGGRRRNDYLDELGDRVRLLRGSPVPRRPAAAAAYYDELVRAWKYAESNSDAPAKDLAKALDISVHTLRTRLRTARHMERHSMGSQPA